VARQGYDPLQRLVRQPFWLLIVRPHPDNLYGLHVFYYLINKAMLNVDSPGIGAGEIPYELFKGRRVLIRVFRKDIEQSGCGGFET
jgi:hypothetical protein